jgi:hypothetical protein
VSNPEVSSVFICLPRAGGDHPVINDRLCTIRNVPAYAPARGRQYLHAIQY